MDKIKKNSYLLLLSYSIILFLLNFIRIFDNNFWGDEAFSINLVKNPLSVVLEITGNDVHPPLYYILLKYLAAPFGFNPYICHAVSLLPFAILLIFSLIVIRKEFGSWVCVLFCTMISLPETALRYNVEVRMYSWGALFLFLSYYYSYKIIRFGLWRYYLLFLVTSIAAAYTHYYCLISVSVFYLGLFLLCFLRRVSFFRFLLTSFLAVVLYVPWLSYLVRSVKQTLSDYWISEIPSFYECCIFVFSNHCVLLIVAIVMILSFLISARKKNTAEKYHVIAGVSCFLFTMFCGEVASYIFRPVLRLHYLYPVSVVMWFVFALSVRKFSYYKAMPQLSFILILFLTIGPYLTLTKREIRQNCILNQTLRYTSQLFDKDDVLLTDNPLLNWSVIPYYYPDLERHWLSSEVLPNLSDGKRYWLICSEKSQKSMKKYFKALGYLIQRTNIREKRKRGSLGNDTVILFKVVSKRD